MSTSPRRTTRRGAGYHAFRGPPSGNSSAPLSASARIRSGPSPGARASSSAPCSPVTGRTSAHLVLCRREARRRADHRAGAAATVVDLGEEVGARARAARAGLGSPLARPPSFARAPAVRAPPPSEGCAGEEGRHRVVSGARLRLELGALGRTDRGAQSGKARRERHPDVLRCAGRPRSSRAGPASKIGFHRRVVRAARSRRCPASLWLASVASNIGTRCAALPPVASAMRRPASSAHRAVQRRSARRSRRCAAGQSARPLAPAVAQQPRDGVHDRRVRALVAPLGLGRRSRSPTGTTARGFTA